MKPDEATAGLTDYEVRDLNDEINKLMREKRHWENQIVALGGANYRRNVAMVDDDGREVPGTKGYKCVMHIHFRRPPLKILHLYRYFGRAKDLPGVKELFQSKKKEEEEENQIVLHYKRFVGQGPGYFGDLDESDETLLEFEREAEEAGEPLLFLCHKALHLARVPDWEEAHLNIRAVLRLPVDEDPPKMARWNVTRHDPTSHPPAPDQPSAKRKVRDDSGDGPDSIMAEAEDLKRVKTSTRDASTLNSTTTPSAEDAARAAAAFISFLTAEDLAPPKLPTREEMENVLLGLRKRALMSEYFGGRSEAAEA